MYPKSSIYTCSTGWVKCASLLFLFCKKFSRFLPGTTWSLKRYCIREILTWCAIRLPYPVSPWPVPSSHPRLTVVPQLLPVTSGDKQWRDVGHENGSAFVAGNCLSFCYFVASKSRMSAGVLSQTITCRGDFYDGDVFSYFRDLLHLFYNFRTSELFLIYASKECSFWYKNEERLM